MSRCAGMEKITLNISEAAELLGISRSTLYASLLHQEDFPAFKIGNRILIPREKLIAWANNREKNFT